MTPEQKAAHVMAMVACAMAEIAAMQAANNDGTRPDPKPPYSEQDFRDVIDRNGVHHNAVLTLFRN